MIEVSKHAALRFAQRIIGVDQDELTTQQYQSLRMRINGELCTHPLYAAIVNEKLSLNLLHEGAYYIISDGVVVTVKTKEMK